jgi:hypothetical protein
MTIGTEDSQVVQAVVMMVKIDVVDFQDFRT